jgi:hypothetical protein
LVTREKKGKTKKPKPQGLHPYNRHTLSISLKQTGQLKRRY